MELTLPYLVIRGEQLRVPVTVYNYMDFCVQVGNIHELSEEIISLCFLYFLKVKFLKWYPKSQLLSHINVWFCFSLVFSILCVYMYVSNNIYPFICIIQRWDFPLFWHFCPCPIGDLEISSLFPPCHFLGNCLILSLIIIISTLME